MRFRTTAIGVVTAALLANGCSSSPAPAPSTATAPPATTHRTTSPAPATPKPTHTRSAAQNRSLASVQLHKMIAAQPDGGVSVAALNTATGASYRAGAKSGMWTASAYKLLMVVSLILEDGSFPSGQLGSATRALENSDNAAGYSLFLAAGGRSGIQGALDKLGMAHTVPGQSDPTFTTTSGSDYLKLLKALVTKGALPASAQSTVLGLMHNVESDQRWGVGVVADKGTDFANKNGWLSIDDSNGPGETDNGLWAVTSVGIVTVAHQQVLMSVFTRHQKSFGTGVSLVQTLARSLIKTVSPKG